MSHGQYTMILKTKFLHKLGELLMWTATPKSFYYFNLFGPIGMYYTLGIFPVKLWYHHGVTGNRCDMVNFEIIMFRTVSSGGPLFLFLFPSVPLLPYV